MNLEECFAALGAHLQRQLNEEFPAWRITLEESGGWIAVRPGWGTVHASSSTELRERLRHHIAQGGGHHF